MNATWLPYQTRLREQIELKSIYPHQRFSGRGIVTCAGGERYFPGAYVLIRILRMLGCTLPVEVWYLEPSEMPTKYKQILEQLNARAIDAEEIRKTHPMRIMKGWEMKSYAIINSAFEEVLFLDADNIPVVDPTFLFETKEYKDAGAIFWPDRGRLSPTADIWKICEVEFNDEPEFETGQVLVNKRESWHALNITKHLNEWSDFYYSFVHGDKETFHFGWKLAKKSFCMAPPNYDQDWMVLHQHDLKGNRLFQHRSGDKWSIYNINYELPHFIHESHCFTFLEELVCQTQSGEHLQFFDRVFLVNLDKDEHRLKKASSRLDKAGIPFERISAISHQNGHRGCALTHRMIMQMAVERGYHRVLVFEDDVIVRDDFSNWIKILAPQMNQHPWDLFYFGLHLCDSGDFLSDNIGKVIEGYHTHAYAFNIHAVPRLTKCIDEYLSGTHSIFDGFHCPKIRKLYCTPILAIQEPGYSYTLQQDYNRFPQYFSKFDRKEFVQNCKELQTEFLDIGDESKLSLDATVNNLPPSITLIISDVTNSSRNRVHNILKDQLSPRFEVHFESNPDLMQAVSRWDKVLPIGNNTAIKGANEWIAFLDEEHLPDAQIFSALSSEIAQHPAAEIIVFNLKSRYGRTQRIADMAQIGPAFACRRSVICEVYTLNGKIISTLFFEHSIRRHLRIIQSKSITYYKGCEPFFDSPVAFKNSVGIFSLGIPMYYPTNKVRWDEYLHCLKANLHNPFIQRILVVEEDDIIRNVLFDTLEKPLFEKLTFHPFGKRALFSDVSAALHQHFNETLCVVSNADIYFDHSLQGILELNLDKLFIALSRWDLVNNSLVPYPVSTSQDAWIFMSPLPPEVGRVPFGTPDCDYRIAFQANEAGYCLLNPMKDVKAIHWHASQLRNYSGSILLSGEKIRSIPFSCLTQPVSMDEPFILEGSASVSGGELKEIRPIDHFEGIPSQLVDCKCLLAQADPSAQLVISLSVRNRLILALPIDRARMPYDSQGIIDRFMKKIQWPFVRNSENTYFELWMIVTPMEFQLELVADCYLFIGDR